MILLVWCGFVAFPFNYCDFDVTFVKHNNYELLQEEIIHCIQNPHLIGGTEIEALKEMTERYPYASLFQVLLAKGLHNRKDLDYEDVLRKAALVTSDRGVLYRLIYSTKVQQVIKDTEESVEITDAFVDTKIEEHPEPIVETKSPEGRSREGIKEDSDNNKLEEDILLEAINTSIQMDVDALLQEEIPNTLDAWISKETKLEEVEEVETSVVIENPKKLSDWLSNMKKISDVEETKESLPKQQALKSPKELIDKFIGARSVKIDVSKEPITPQELGKMSLMENEDFVTETLASIYAKQGKYEKAIKIYHQLILKIPEKKTFFASRIRFLKEKMEYDN